MAAPESVRAELERILASPEFASSRQLQEFLRFSSEKALAGAIHLDQVEIAQAVLGRGDDFNPLDDASVRKLASMARHRLEQFYARSGTQSGIRITLPVRSYLPKFEEAVAQQPQPSPWPVRMAVATLAAAALSLALVWWLGRLGMHGTARGSLPPVVVRTAAGDLIGKGADVPPDAIRLGPELGEFDTVTARLAFTPEREAHQAGILVWSGPDHFVKLGRRFFGRNQIEFSYETPSALSGTPQPAMFDPDGQSGQPVWLSIRRQGNTYYGFFSRDGQVWEPVGAPINPNQPLERPRAGLYAYHGRRQAPSIAAEFTHLSTGVVFDPFDAGLFAAMLDQGWQRQSTCGEAIEFSFPRPVLKFHLKPDVRTCNTEITRPISGNDWAVETRLDFFPIPGASAGISVRGDQGSVRLVRYFLNGPSISFIHDAHTLTGVPDLNGSPAVVLRLWARAGVLSGAFSTDGERFRELPVKVPLSQLGAHPRAGLRVSVTALPETERFPPARFYYFRQAILSLRNHR
jgi:hypothetical protein